MKPRLQLAACFSTLLFTSVTVHADTVTWIGPATGGDFFEPTNWDDSTGPTAGTAFVGDLVISDAAAVGGTGGGLILASGSTFTATNCTIDITFGLQSIPDLTTDGTINLINSTVNTSSISNDLVANLTALSVLNLSGTGNAVNGLNTPTNNTRVNLADGCKISQTAGNNATNSGSQSVGSRIFRTDSGTSFATDFASLPLTEFTLTGDQTPFVAPNGGAFTITAVDPNAPVVTTLPDIIVGYRLVPPEASQVIWYPTYRTATDWQINLDNPQIAFFGWAGITDVYLADLNGDGLSDKVMRQTANNGGANPSQIIATYTTAPPTGFATSNSFTDPLGDIDVPFGFLSASKTDLIFGDIDGDKIDDSGVYVEGSEVGGSANVMVWGILKSNGQIGISTDQGGFSNFVGWAAFGDKALGDKPYMGDFNGDGIADRLIYRVSANQAFIDLSVSGGFGDGVADYGPISLGIPGDRLYVTDINGDGKDDLALARDTSAQTPGLQTLYGFYNDGTGFSTLNGSSPNITDFWGVGEGILFGNLTPLPVDMSKFQITQVTTAGPELAFAGTFFAPAAGSYEIQANLDLTSPWQLMGTVAAATSGSTAFSISDAQLDSTFGPATRPKVFIRVVKQP